MVFLGFEALQPLKWPKNFLVLKKNPYLVNLVLNKVGSSTCSKKTWQHCLDTSQRLR